jgi:hypothetical protein
MVLFTLWSDRPEGKYGHGLE